MPISALPQAPFRQDRKIFPTPIVGDVLFSEVRDCNRGNPFPEYGSPYPNANKWPDHKLVYIKPVDIERNEIFEFFYAAERENQDLYNFAFGLRNIGNREFRTVTRTYVTLRENFKPTDIEFGTPMPNVPEDKFEGVNYVFYDKEQQNTQQEELNALFVIEVHSYVEEAVLDEVLTLSTERQDPLPPKFRVLSPTTTTDELAEGSVETPVLTGDQLAATEDQINTNLKRKRTVSRSSANNTTSLSGKQVTNDLQVANVVETIVPDGTTITTSALTVDGSVESLGNGQSIQRVITAPELFAAETFAAERPDVVPEKFRVAIPTTTTEERIEGTAEEPTLDIGDLAATEQQENKFVKRVRKTKRDSVSLPVTLSQKTTTNEKQVATVTEELQVGDTTETSTATVDIESQALGDGTYVVRKVQVPELFTAETFAAERPDVVPEKFRVAIPTTTTEERIEGTAEEPTLDIGDLAATEQQENKFVKRVRKTKRDSVSLPVTLSQKTTTNEKQVATVTEELQVGDTTETSTATVDIESQALGDGTYVVRKVQVPELFTAESYSAERPDVVPEKFRVAIPTTTEEWNEEGFANIPTLETGDIAVIEQQQNVHVKRTRKTKRDTAALPKSLTQKATTNEKQIATITETLQIGDTSETPTATKDIQSEVLGDGTYVVRKIEVPELFGAKSYSIQKPDVVPEKFRAQVPTTTEQLSKSGQAVPPSLATGELERSQQQVNDFVYREQVSKRDLTNEVLMPEVQQAYVEGTIGKVNEKLSSNSTIEKGLLVSESRATSIGDEKFVVQTVKVESWPELKGSEWDYLLNTQVVSTQQMVVPPTTFNETNTSYKAVNEDRSLKIVEEAPTDALNSYLVSLPTRTDMQLPAVLKSIEAVWVSDTAISDGDSQGTGVMPTGGGVSLQAQASSAGSAKQSAVPSIKTEIENVIGSDISATAYFFYYNAGNGSMNETNLVNRLSTLIGQSVNVWPIFKAKSHTIVTRGASVSAATKASADQTNVITIDGTTGNSQSRGEEFTWAIDRSVDVINLGPTIHAALNITGASQYIGISATSSASARLTGDFDVTASKTYTANAQVSIVPTSFPATSPADIPRSGLYIVSSKAEPFKWGWVKCFALVVNADQFAS